MRFFILLIFFSFLSFAQEVNTKETDMQTKDIYFAGGCFWGVEEYFSRIDGVLATSAGYANGNTANPTYNDVIYKNTNHAETVHVKYDPNVVSLKTLVEQYFKIIDPTSLNKQGNDAGVQYRTGVYYTDESDKELIGAVFTKVRQAYSKPILVELLPLKNFYFAEEYHQKYLKKNPNGYCHISYESLDDIIYENRSKYKKPSQKELKEKLSRAEYKIAVEGGTEAPFSGEYVNNKRKGIYVDVITGEPLFSSSDKYDSGSGWPSFTKPISKNILSELSDYSYGMSRVEVKSKMGDTHLGHVFDDGLKDKGGLRYCINSASLKFIPLEEMEKEGYKEYIKFVK